jgi:hypothetical protein
MMTAIVQCPNSACGRVSHLGQDPLGRIFRCPRCRTKLPTASASAGDPGWTAIMGPPQLGHARARLKLGRIGSRFGSDQDYKSNAGQVGTSSAGGSCQAIPDGVDALSRYDCGVITAASLGLGPDDSGEIFTSSVACSDSTCGSISRPSISAVVGL